ncbi:MAG: hypothetical protein J5669_08075 [Bacteroidales bacterium]|nr:hypothetical protein [Bacteroidales bacterium]
MEKSHTEFLQECAAELAALKERIAALEEKLATWEAPSVPEDDAVDFTSEAIGQVEEIPGQAGNDGGQAGGVLAGNVMADVDRPSPKAEPMQEDDTVKMRWRTALPGMRVKNIRSGISLYDRAFFVSSLFKEDAALYDSSIATLNEMGSLNEAVAWIRGRFPEWDLNSDAVFHFIMAIRKKLG